MLSIQPYCMGHTVWPIQLPGELLLRHMIFTDTSRQSRNLKLENQKFWSIYHRERIKKINICKIKKKFVLRIFFLAPNAKLPEINDQLFCVNSKDIKFIHS